MSKIVRFLHHVVFMGFFDIGGSAKKVGKRIKELERLYGIKNGGSGFYGNRHTESVDLTNNSEGLKTQEQLAKEFGISVDTLQNYKMLSDMIPELEELDERSAESIFIT